MFSILSSRRWSRSQIYLYWLFAPRSFHWETDSAKINFSATSYHPFLQIHFHWKWNPISLRDNSIFIVRPFLLWWLASQPCMNNQFWWVLSFHCDAYIDYHSIMSRMFPDWKQFANLLTGEAGGQFSARRIVEIVFQQFAYITILLITRSVAVLLEIFEIPNGCWSRLAELAYT